MGRKALVLGCGPIAGVDGARERVLENSVMEKTLKGYRSDAKIFDDFLAEQGGTAKEAKNYWFLFCETYCKKSDKATKESLESYRSAILFLQDLGQYPGSWAADTDVKRACYSARYKKGVKKLVVPRGALDEEKLADLRAYLIEKEEMQMLEFVDCCWGTHSRIEELLQLAEDKVVDEGILIPNKNYCCKTADTEPPFTLKGWSIILPEARVILERRRLQAAARKKASLLFPSRDFKAYQLRAVMKKCAVENEWGGDLVFDVPHCLRHTGIEQMVAEGKGAELKSSLASLKRYGAPNAARGPKGDKKAKKAFQETLKVIKQERAKSRK